MGGGQREVVLENKALVLEEGNRGQAIPGGSGPRDLSVGGITPWSGGHLWAPAGAVRRPWLGRNSDTTACFLGIPAADSLHVQVVDPQGAVSASPTPRAPHTGHW